MARKTDAAQTKRRKTALQLRVEGKTLEHIGRALGVSKQRAHQIVQAEIEQAQDETRRLAHTALHLELERVDFVLRSLTPAVLKADPKAATAFLKAMERRAKLLGLDRPEKHEVSGSVNVEPSALYARIGAIAARAAGAGTAGAAGDPDPGAAGDPRPGG